MDEGLDFDAADVSEAIVLWTGFGHDPWPSRKSARVLERFGPLAEAILGRVKELEKDFNASDARFAIEALSEMGDVAASSFRERHPEISEEAVRALRWCYTYGNR